MNNKILIGAALVLLLVYLFSNCSGNNTELVQPATSSDCPLVVKPRSSATCEPFATSNGTLDWLVTHPSYYEAYYHGYYPWSTDDYSRFNPFDLNSPYFFLN